MSAHSQTRLKQTVPPLKTHLGICKTYCMLPTLNLGRLECITVAVTAGVVRQFGFAPQRHNRTTLRFGEGDFIALSHLGRGSAGLIADALPCGRCKLNG